MGHTKCVLAGSIRITFTLFIFVCLTVNATGCKAWTVVKMDSQAGSKANAGIDFNDPSFDPNGYVDSIWSSKVIPYMKAKAANVTTVLGAIKGNIDQAGGKYGYKGSGTDNSWKFIVAGTGKVLAVNSESRAGIMDIDLPPYDNKKDIAIAIGPVFKGTSIRDSLDFIQFEEFKNQIQYAQLANAFNKKVYDTIIGPANVASLANQEISFIGSFAYDGKSIVITPVQISQAKGAAP